MGRTLRDVCRSTGVIAGEPVTGAAELHRKRPDEQDAHEDVDVQQRMEIRRRCESDEDEGKQERTRERRQPLIAIDPGVAGAPMIRIGLGHPGLLPIGSGYCVTSAPRSTTKRFVEATDGDSLSGWPAVRSRASTTIVRPSNFTPVTLMRSPSRTAGAVVTPPVPFSSAARYKNGPLPHGWMSSTTNVSSRSA